VTLLPPRRLAGVERCAGVFFAADFVERFAPLAAVPLDFGLPRRSSDVAAGSLLRRARVLRADPRAVPAVFRAMGSSGTNGCKPQSFLIKYLWCASRDS
jgi:hypothetical protein